MSLLAENDTAKHILLAVSVILIVVVLSLKMSAKDPYGTFHLALNIRPGHDPSKSPETEWLNMGYWKVA